jgi:hypothetical protein
VLVPALRAEIVAQARHYSRAVPGTGTILTGPGRAWTVLFRAVPGPAHRVSAKWPSIVNPRRHPFRKHAHASHLFICLGLMHLDNL